MNVSLVVNPVAGNRAYKLIPRIETLLKRSVSLTTYVTRKQGDASQIVKQIQDADRIFVAGGDGTINEVINGLLSAKEYAPEMAPSVSIIPLGTANVLARELAIPADVEQAVEHALTGKEKRISLGRINDRYFILMAGIGFDGEIVRRVNKSMFKRVSGYAAHITTGLKVLQQYNPCPVTVVTPRHEITGYTLVIGNAHYYGGGFSVTPRASLTEPLLDLCLFRGRTRRDLLRFIAGVIMQRHLSYDDVVYEKVSSLDVSSERSVPLQIDGEYFGTLPARVEVIQDAVSLIC